MRNCGVTLGCFCLIKTLYPREGSMWTEWNEGSEVSIKVDCAKQYGKVLVILHYLCFLEEIHLQCFRHFYKTLLGCKIFCHLYFDLVKLPRASLPVFMSKPFSYSTGNFEYCVWVFCVLLQLQGKFKNVLINFLFHVYTIFLYWFGFDLVSSGFNLLRRIDSIKNTFWSFIILAGILATWKVVHVSLGNLWLPVFV